MSPIYADLAIPPSSLVSRPSNPIAVQPLFFDIGVAFVVVFTLGSIALAIFIIYTCRHRIRSQHPTAHLDNEKPVAIEGSQFLSAPTPTITGSRLSVRQHHRLDGKVEESAPILGQAPRAVKHPRKAQAEVNYNTFGSPPLRPCSIPLPTQCELRSTALTSTRASTRLLHLTSLLSTDEAMQKLAQLYAATEIDFSDGFSSILATKHMSSSSRQRREQ
ncbi:hypothetical protein ONZ45_g17824 [Pleurotus djamor]|nr:hypothetical protein ONZ45_g17824 [Pleurotus djamor]